MPSETGTAIKYGWTVVLVALIAVGVTRLLGFHSLSADTYLLAIKATILGMMVSVILMKPGLFPAST